ncbi:MAG: UDP-N-acetylmuramoyl-tripeptide--D-alanyl-D-alanine ligase, partial [Clostridia bacterium]|nr:UDP-N-acetylmuramoyl-tripeptide--D-alanyl-D-alanine ligase [Clostridia bacterium]
MRIKLERALMLSDILNALNVTVTNAQSDAEITHITTSSKECFKGDLFVALVGARHNGNDYVGEVLSLGAYAICARRIEGAYFVEDTALALLKIANLYKNRLKHFKKLIAITGSVGKSSTKELTAELLKGKYKTHRSAGNENNIIGVSYTLLCAPSDTEIIVAEVGMNHKGEIRAISEIISPDISIITNVGTAHIGNLGSREAIAAAKLEILSGMGFHGRLLVDGDEPLLDGYGAISVSSESGECDAFMHVIELTSERSVCDFYYGESIIYNLSFLPLGKHMLKNLAFAVLISMLLKMNESEIKDAISKISADIFRQKMISVANFSILDDSYNASVEALKSMLDYLMLFSGRRKSLVFSEIL